MTRSLNHAVLLAKRTNAFDPPPGLAEGPIVRFILPGGHPGWLATGYSVVREILADSRFSVDPCLVRPSIREFPEDFEFERQPGMFLQEDPPRHTRYRKLLTGQFTTGRMRGLTSMIESFVDDLLDELAAAGPPADLVETFARPLPSAVIGELLGIERGQRDEFLELVDALVRLGTSPEEFGRRLGELQEFMLNLVLPKRNQPAHHDVITGIAAADPALTDRELTNICILLLLGGNDTTANMFGLGAFALLAHRDQFELLRADPSLIPGAVEELLRYLSIVQFGVERAATEDVDVGGVTVRAGETVVLHLPQANRDRACVSDPDVLDVTRERVRHLGFGHGIHQCIGQQLARAELVIGFSKLINRFPDLRLAVEPAEIPLRSDMEIYGVHKLPVTWGPM